MLVAAFVLLGVAWISRPGLYYDETLFVLASYPRDDTAIAYTMHLGKQPVALMLIEYLGALKGWIYAPLLHVFSGSAALVRVPALLIGAAALVFLYFLARRAFGPAAALAALALAASDPVYLFTTRLDWGPVVIQRLCLAAGCYGVLRWWQERGFRHLFWGCFVFGVGVFDKATFLWLLAALGLATVAAFPRQLCTRLPSFSLLLLAAAR
jgi:4-amino-4-deoxy-L-arabinose transferase-like glycosyltransferase